MKKNLIKWMSCCALGSVVMVFMAAVSCAKTTTTTNILASKPLKVDLGNQQERGGIMDLSVLPMIKGTVDQYLPTPYGNLNGLLLTDGTQVIFSTMFGEGVRSFVHPGQSIAVYGLKAKKIPLIQAFEIKNQRGQSIQEDSPETGSAPIPITGPDLYVNGVVDKILYNLQGQIMGVVLKDNTVIYVRLSDIQKLGFKLRPDIMLYARGTGSVNVLGKALQARMLGLSRDKMIELSQLNAPPPGPPAGSPSYDYIP